MICILKNKVKFYIKAECLNKLCFDNAYFLKSVLTSSKKLITLLIRWSSASPPITISLAECGEKRLSLVRVRGLSCLASFQKGECHVEYADTERTEATTEAVRNRVCSGQRKNHQKAFLPWPLSLVCR